MRNLPMHKLFGVVFSLSLFGCNNSVNDSLSNHTEEHFQAKQSSVQTLSLNGTWKFNTFNGDGFNYRDITPNSTDIIVDDSDTQFIEINGDWKVGKEGARGSRQWGDSHLYHWSEINDPENNVKFFYPEFKAGYYEHFIYYPFAFGLHNNFIVKHDNGLTTRDINQRNRDGQWLSLGIYKISPETKPYISAANNSKRQVIADAIMLRPVSEQAYITAQKNKQLAPSIETADDHWFDLKVPGHWGMINKYSTYTGKGWYRKTFQLPSDWQVSNTEKLRLAFDGVYHYAKVYVNGEYIGSHQGGFTPFELDVTKQIKLTGDNVIAVEADNSPIVGATWNWGGIIRDVNLVKSQDVRIKYQHIHAEPNLESGTAALTLKVRVENSSNKSRVLDFSATVLKETSLANLTHQFNVAANTTTEFEVSGSLSKEQVKLWHFDDPQLYHLSSSISEDGEVVNEQQERFGIRKIELTQSQMLLNGEPVRIGGYNRVSDHRYWGSSEPYELLVKDVELMKNAGANFMRIMHGTQNKTLMDLCDEKGILVFEEINVRELNNPEFTAPEYPLTKQWAREMVERDINHPSIIGWSVGNELTEHYQYAETMLDYVRELDPHRLVTNVSNTAYYKNDTPENDPIGLSDLMMQNIYQKDPEKVITTISERWPNKPIFVSEYGLGRFDSASLDNDYPNFSSWHDMLRGRNTHVVGTSVWSFNDYRSAYAQTLEEENRSWGLVNNWRQKRRAYKTFQEGLTPIKAFKLTGVDLEEATANVEFSTRDVTDYPSFTMRNYKLQWNIVDVNGNILQEKSVALPTLTPDYGKFKQAISWSPKVQNAHKLMVKVLSTNGFVRYNTSYAFTAPATPIIKGVLTTDGKIRIVFDKIFSGYEYYVRYKDEAGKALTSAKTINHYIELAELDSDKSYQLELVASNAFGDSKASQSVTVTPKGALLPPVIWKSMIRDNKLVVGFSGEVIDSGYVVKYGYSADKLNLTATTSSRGMITADIDESAKTVFFQLKRLTSKGESSWSLMYDVKGH